MSLTSEQQSTACQLISPKFQSLFLKLPLRMLVLNRYAGPSSQSLTRAASSATNIVKRKNSAPFRGKLSKPTRVFPPQKALLVRNYVELFEKSQLVLFLRLQNVSVADMHPIRTAIRVKNLPFQLTFLKANLLPPVLRALPTLPSAQLESYLKGPLAVLTADSVDPISLKSFLTIFDKQRTRLNKPPPNQPKGVVVKSVDKLQLLTGVMENKEYDAAGIKRVSTLPSLAELHSQITGLIQGSARFLLSTLQAASGVQVVRTLEGYKQGLEGEQSV